MAVAHHTVISRWGSRASTNEPEDRLSMTGGNVFATGDTIYSYGRHFPMATIVRDSRTNEPTFILINGDRYSNTTSGHQSSVRSEARQTGLPNLIVPFTALDAAGVLRDSIVPLEVLADRYTYHPRVVTGEHVAENTWRFRMENDTLIDQYGDREPEPLGNGRWRVWDKRHWLGEAVFAARINCTRYRRATAEEIELHQRWQAWHEHHTLLRACEDDARRDVTDASRAAERYHGTWAEHTWPQAHRDELESLRSYVEDLRLASLAHYDHEPPRLDVTVEQHRGRWRVPYRGWRKAKFLSAFDHNEARECYFLCELPKTAAVTVDEAFLALRPKPVVLAQDAGLHVERQGDIFAIPTSLTTRELKSRAKLVETNVYNEETNVFDRVKVPMVKRGRLLTTNHTATEVIVTKDGDTYARGILRHEVSGWRTPDHARRKMGDGKTWHRIIKNTVPLATDRTNSSGNLFQSGQSRAWTMGGSVD